MSKHEILNDLFRQAREQEAQLSFAETKALFLNSLESQEMQGKDSKKGRFSGTKIRVFLSVLIGILLLGSSLVLVQGREKNTLPQSASVAEKTNHGSQKSIQDSGTSEKSTHSGLMNTAKNRDNTIRIAAYPGLPFLENKNQESTEKSEDVIKPALVSAHQDPEDGYQFPKLTEKEIGNNHKQKKKMLKALAKFDKDQFAYIPSGSFESNGKLISVQAFYMQKTEVSNLEYRTFLFDLLINDKKEEFLKARPDQHSWTVLLGDSLKIMEQTYFSDEKYNDFPVCNISREGAEMYCIWLSRELSAFVGPKKQEDYNDVRIPHRDEWLKAASNEGKQLPFPWDGESILIPKFMSFQANFNLKKYTGYLDKKQQESMKHKTYYTTANYFFFGTNDAYTVEVKSRYFLCNASGLYNMSGNVAEMVYNGYGQNGTKTCGTAGGGWMNSVEEIKTYAPDNHPGETKAHPNIGFRIVMTSLAH